MGRFINRDPSEEKGGLNLYAFCRNNGVNLWDRLGLDTKDIDGGNGFAWGGDQFTGSSALYGTGDRNDMGFMEVIAGPNGSFHTPTSSERSAMAMAVVNAQWANVVATVMPELANSLIQSTTNGIIAGAQAVLNSAGSRMLATYGQATNARDVLLGRDITVGIAQATSPGADMALVGAQSIAQQLGWNGFTENLSESQQVYYGTTAANILTRQAAGKDVGSLWQAVVGEVPGVITDSGHNPVSPAADLGRTKFLAGVGALGSITPLVTDTLARIARGESNPHRNDGSIFKNREGLLPNQRPGYYREYVVPTPGKSGPGLQRLVIGDNGEVYYTADHYKTFTRVPTGGGGSGGGRKGSGNLE